MLVLSRDGRWLERLERIAGRGGWPFEARAALTAPAAAERALAVLDRGLAGAAPKKAVAELRARHPSAAIALVFDAMDHDAAADAVSCGADEVLRKSWPDATLSRMLGALRDRALAAQERSCAGGALKAELRSHRALVKTRGRWKELKLDAGGFALLWRLLEREGEAVSRAELAAALSAASGREFEAGTVARRLAALKKTLGAWPGSIETARGGFYRLVPDR